MAKNNIVEDNFVTIDDYDDFMEYLNIIYDDYSNIVTIFDDVIEEGVFNKNVYMNVTSAIRYTSKRLFPQLLAFFGQDSTFEEDIYPEFMDIQLMVLYLFDKLQYNLDEAIIKWKLNDAVIDDELINLHDINYVIQLVFAQLSLFENVFDLKIKLLEKSIGEEEFERRMVELHDEMFL